MSDFLRISIAIGGIHYGLVRLWRFSRIFNPYTVGDQLVFGFALRNSVRDETFSLHMYVPSKGANLFNFFDLFILLYLSVLDICLCVREATIYPS